MILSLVFTTLTAPPQLAAMPLVAKNMAVETVQILDLILVSELEATGMFSVVRPADIDAMLGLERMKDAVGCDDVSCATDLASALGVQLLMTGTVGKLGNEIVIELTLIDTAAERVRHRGQATAPVDERAYRDAVKRAVASVLELKAAPTPAAAANVKLAPVTLRFDTTESDRRFEVRVVTSDGIERSCPVDEQNSCTLTQLALGNARIHAASAPLGPFNRSMTIEDRKETVVQTLHEMPSLGAITCWTYGGTALAAGIALIAVGAATHQSGFLYGGIPAAAVGGGLLGLGFTFNGQIVANTSRLREDGKSSWWPF
jgi:hypothetical protein